MKNTYVIIFLLTLLSPCVLSARGQEEAQGIQEAQVIAEKAKIYLEASPFSIVIDTIQHGTVVALFPSGKKDKKWLYISYYSIKRDAQVTGFIKANTVEIFQEKPEPNQEKTEEKPEETKDKMDSPPVDSDSAKPATDKEEKDLSSEGEKPKEIKNEEQAMDRAKTAKTEDIEKQKEEKIESTGQEKKEIPEKEEAKQNAEAPKVDKATTAEEGASPAKNQEIQEEESKMVEESAVKEKEQTQEEKASTEEQPPPEKNAGRNTDKEKGIAEEAKEQKIDKNKDTVQKFIEKGKEQVTEKEETALEEEEVESRNLEKEGAESDVPEKKEEDPPQVLTKVSIKVQKANIRLMPSLQSTVIHQVPSGVELRALAKTGKWFRVNLPPNEDGFVLSGYIHHSIVSEIYESVQPVVEPEEPEEEPEIIEKDPESIPKPEKEMEPATRTEKRGLSLWIGGGGGYTLPSESRFEKGMSIGGTLGLEIMKYLAVELRIPYFQSEVAESFEGLSSGQLRNLTFMLSLQARYPLNDRFIPYLVGGWDYHLNKFILNEGIKNSWNNLGFTIEENVDHSFGFHAGAGIDFFLMRDIALNVDVRYYTANLKGTRSISNQVTQQEVLGVIENIKLNSIQAGISVKFFLRR